MNMAQIHDEIEEWLAASVTGALSPAERENFERHLAECERCRALHEQEKTMSAMIGKTFSELKPDPDFEARIARQFRRSVASRRNYLSSLARLFQARSVRWAAAALVLIALVKGGMILTGESFRTPTLGSERLAINKEARQEALPEAPVQSSISGDAGDTVVSLGSSTLALSGANTITGATTFSGGTLKLEAKKTSTDFSKLEKQTRALRDEERSTDGSPVGSVSMSSGETSASVPISSAAIDALLSLQDRKAKVDQDAAAQPAAQATPPSAAAPPEQKLIRNANVEFEVANFETAADAITGIATEEQGYVATRNSARGANGKLSGTIVVKMPPRNLDGFLLKIHAVGELKSQTLGAEDVTKAYFDTDARLRNAKRMEERLLDLLARTTGKVSDLLQVEKELGRVRGQIEEMQGQLKYWDALVAYATVTVSLYEKEMNQPAAFLLKEHANLSLLSRDVEKTYAEAKREAEAANAQILQSRLERDGNGRVSATLSVLLAPETADQTIARVKTLGRIQDFTTQDERVAQNGSGNSSDAAKVVRDKVELNLVIEPDDESRRQTGLTVVARPVEEALDKAKTAAVEQGAEVLDSNVTRDPQGRGAGQLQVRVPAKSYNTVLDVFKKLGRVTSLTVQRNDRAGAGDDNGPVLISLALGSEEDPVQHTDLGIVTGKVEEKSGAIKQAAAEAGIEVKKSTFERQPGGIEVANLVFQMPMKSYAPFVEQIRGLGKVKNFTVNRDDTGVSPGAPGDESAPARITLQLYSEGNIVPDENGIFPTIRRTVSQGAAALMWSARMIGVAVAFVAPWGVALALIVWLVSRARSARAKKL